MSGYRRVNYYELCRLCTSSDGAKLNIFLEDGRRRQLQTKIETYLPVQVTEDDSLPKIVCLECVKKLESYIEFRDSVRTAESMLESYFTSIKFSEDFLKEGKVYVKTTAKEEKSAVSEEVQTVAENDETLTAVEEKIVQAPASSQIMADQTQSQAHPVVVSNINASNLQIISGVQARVQQYKCAMQMQSGNVAAAVVEATAETHYSYQQQTSQQQHQLSTQQNQIQVQIQEPQQSQNQNQNQNHQIVEQQVQQTVQTLRQLPQQQQQQPSSQTSQVSQAAQIQEPQQNQSQITQQQLQQLQRQQQQRHLHQSANQQQQSQHIHIATAVAPEPQQASPHVEMHRSIILKTEDVNEQNLQAELQKNEATVVVSQQQNHQPTFTTVQATPEVFLSLGFKDALAATQVQATSREEAKELKEFVKTTEDAMTRTSISHISEFLRIRTAPEQQPQQQQHQQQTPLVTVNPQAITQTRQYLCRDCGKTFMTLNQMNEHDCTTSLLSEQVREITNIKEEAGQTQVVVMNGAGNVNGATGAVAPASGNARRGSSSNRSSSGNNGNVSSDPGANPFSCDVCNKPFKRKEHLFQHRKLHTGERPYVCTSCAKAFSRKEHLVRHLVSHTGQKMHECEKCGKSFSRKDNLHKHRKTHGMAGPYICETCGKSFVVKHYYLMHLTTHAPANADGLDSAQDALPYKCDICHKGYTNKQYLTTHKLRHRSKNSSNSSNNNNNAASAAAAVNSQQQQQNNGQQQVQQQVSSTSELTVTRDITSVSLSNGTAIHPANGSVIEIQGVVDRAEAQQQQQQQQQAQAQSDTFVGNHYQGNVAQFQ